MADLLSEAACFKSDLTAYITCYTNLRLILFSLLPYGSPYFALSEFFHYFFDNECKIFKLILVVLLKISYNHNRIMEVVNRIGRNRKGHIIQTPSPPPKL